MVMPMVIDSVMHIPGVAETKKNVGIKTANKESSIMTTSSGLLSLKGY
jgi:hypothetical protein